MIDIDEGSRYHPGSFDGEGDLPVKAALKTIGLHETIELQSSISTGMHLLYPLDAVVSTWELAQSLEHCLASGGLELKAGVLELRPNVKSYGANYLAIRAPLSGEGNAYWAPQFSDFGLLDDLVLFQQLFAACGSSTDSSHSRDH